MNESPRLSNSIHVSILTTILPRFVRYTFPEKKDRIDVEDELLPVKFLPGFFALPGHTKLSHFAGYKAKHLFPMDISSAIAVLALDLSTQKLDVLDLCCSPGAKFQYILEKLSPDSLLVGVDCSERRLNLCKSMIENNLCHESNAALMGVIPRALLFLKDGCAFAESENDFGQLIFDSKIMIQNIDRTGHRKRKNKSARGREVKQLQQAFDLLTSVTIDQTSEERSLVGKQYDRVIVDAECTHDASYRHLAPFFEEIQSGNSELVDKIISNNSKKWNKRSRNELESEENINIRHYPDREALQSLQRNLISNGFRRLKAGGVMIYSTCSSDIEQNEHIVQWLLDQQPQAKIAAIELDKHLKADNSNNTTITSTELIKSEAKKIIDNAKQLSTADQELLELSKELARVFSELETVPFLEGHLPGTIRLSHELGMSGLFIAKITKTEDVNDI